MLFLFCQPIYFVIIPLSAGDKNTDDKKSIVKAFGIYNTLDSLLYVIVTDAMCAKGVTFVG